MFFNSLRISLKQSFVDFYDSEFHNNYFRRKREAEERERVAKQQEKHRVKEERRRLREEKRRQKRLVG